MLQEHGADAMALQGVSHHKGDLGAVPTGLAVVAPHRREPATYLDHERKPIPVVDVSKAFNFLRQQARMHAEEPSIHRLGGEMVVKIGEGVGVTGPDGSNGGHGPVRKTSLTRKLSRVRRTVVHGPLRLCMGAAPPIFVKLSPCSSLQEESGDKQRDGPV